MTTTVEEPQATFIRPDGREKVTGVGRYTADMNLTGMVHAKFRYADHSHARIVRLDTSKARALPGVLAIVTHEDVPDVRYGAMVKDRRLFAKEKVHFEGDIVAGVAAVTEEIAERAVALIEVGYEPLPAVSDVEAALADDAPLVHEGWEDYEAPPPDGPRPQPGRVLDGGQGRCRRGDGRRGRRRQGALRRRRVARSPDRAARDHRAVGTATG